MKRIGLNLMDRTSMDGSDEADRMSTLASSYTSMRAFHEELPPPYPDGGLDSDEDVKEAAAEALPRRFHAAPSDGGLGF